MAKIDFDKGAYYGRRFYNSSRVEVTKRLNEGRTVAFLDHNEAYAYSRLKKTSIYMLYATIKGDDRLKFFGYAVPS